MNPPSDCGKSQLTKRTLSQFEAPESGSFSARGYFGSHRMRTWPLSILCLLAMLWAGVATEARLLADHPDSLFWIQAADNVAENREAPKGRIARPKLSTLHPVARTASGNGPTLGLAPVFWAWQPHFRLLNPVGSGRVIAPFVRSVVLAAPSLRAPPRG